MLKHQDPALDQIMLKGSPAACRFDWAPLDVSVKRKENPLVAATYVSRIVFDKSLSFTTDRRASRKLSASLWTLQALLASIFTMTGAMKLLMPADLLAAQTRHCL
jgi:hypothetical protein